MPRKPTKPGRPRAAQVIRLDAAPSSGTPSTAVDHCSFCGRGPDEYRAAVRGPAGTICDDCLARAEALTGHGPGTPNPSS
ncbi:MAG: ClpX C4-type zinc finger protein [Gammaproteobacteria bacterium]